jgi:cold shock protein
MTGTIKNVNDKGFGFISSAGLDYFFHRSGVVAARFEDLRPGQSVEFDVVHSDKGPRADAVCPLEN